MKKQIQFFPPLAGCNGESGYPEHIYVCGVCKCWRVHPLIGLSRALMPGYLPLAVSPT